MLKKSTRKRKLTKAEQIARTSDIEISKLKGESGQKTLIEYVRTMRRAYTRRVASFKRAGLVSQAQIAFENSDSHKYPPDLKKLTRNQLLLEFYRYASFFNSETATKQGIAKVNREQDIRIFGKAYGKASPARTMTEQERTSYWQLYNEFINQSPEALGIYKSGNIQVFLGEAVFGDNQIPQGDLTGFFNQLRSRLEESRIKENRRLPNVFSGRGDSFPG